MVRPAERRRVAEWARSAFQVSARRACSAVGVARSTFVNGGEKARDSGVETAVLVAILGGGSAGMIGVDCTQVAAAYGT